MLDIKILIEEHRGLERWKPVLKAPFPLDRTLVAKQVFSLLALAPAPLSRTQYQRDEFLNEVIGSDRRMAMVEVSKQRLRYSLDDCETEFAAVTIDRAERHTAAVEAADPEAVFRTVQNAGMSGSANTSYIREIKRVLGISKP